MRGRRLDSGDGRPAKATAASRSLALHSLTRPHHSPHAKFRQAAGPSRESLRIRASPRRALRRQHRLTTGPRRPRDHENRIEARRNRNPPRRRRPRPPPLADPPPPQRPPRPLRLARTPTRSSPPRFRSSPIIRGRNTSTTTGYGVAGITQGTGAGLYGSSTAAAGIGATYGVYGVSTASHGVFGHANATGAGVVGTSAQGYGVEGATASATSSGAILRTPPVVPR